MSSNTVRGLTIEIDGKTVKLNQAFKESNKLIRETNSEVNDLKKNLKAGWDNDVFVKAQQKARQAVGQTAQKVEQVKRAIAGLGDVSTDEAKKKLEHLTQELDKSETAAKRAKQNLAQINQIKLDRIQAALTKVNQAADSLIRGGAVMTAGITAPLVLLGKQALETASDLQEVQNVVDESFGEGSNSINSWAQNMLDNFGLSELSAKQMAGTFKAMANGMQIADDTGTEMAKTLTELAADMASFYNVSVDVAQTALNSVFTGETESLKKFGVVMTEANLNAYALANGLEEISGDMSQSEKVALRYQYVLQSLSTASGDFARTSDSLANQTRLAQERFKELTASLVEEMLPVAADFLGWLNDLMKGFNDLDESQKKTILTILGIAAAIGPLTTVVGGLTKGVTGAINVFSEFTTKVTSTGSVLKSLWAVVSAHPVGALVTVLGIAAAALISFSNAGSETAKTTARLNESLTKTVDAFNSTAQAAQENASQQQAEVSVTEELINKYEALNTAASKTAEQKSQLANVVQELNSRLPTTISLVDNESGQYDAQADSLRALCDARRQEIELIAARERAVAAANAKAELEDQYQTALENARNANDKLYKFQQDNPFSGMDYREGRTLQELQWDAEEAGKIRDQIESQMAEYDAIIEKYTNSAVETTKSGTQEQVRGEEQALDQRLSNIQSFSSQSTNTQKSMYDQQVSIAKQAYNAIKQNLQDTYNAEIAAIDRALKAKENAINAQIKAINKEIEARRQLKQEEEYNDNIAALQAQLQYGKLDEFSRMELEAELQRQQEEKADYEWELEQQNRIEALNEELENARIVAEQRKADLQEMLEIQMAELEEEYQLHLQQLGVVFNQSSEQMGKISNDFVNTIKAGCESAAATLRAAIAAANSAASRLESARSATYDYSSNTSNFSFYNSGITSGQVRNIVNSALYR